MDDHHGNVIDGTERARQWRRSRQKSAISDETTEIRSDAPKSIASSLLVPADMLDSALSTASPREAAGSSAPEPDTAIADHRPLASSGPAADGANHRNLFLSPDAAVVHQSRQRSRRAGIAAPLAPLISRARSRLTEFRRERQLRPARPRRRARPIPRARPLAAAVTLVAVIAVAAEVVAHSQTHSAPASRSSGSAAGAATFDRLKAAFISSVASAMAAEQAAHQRRSNHARPVRRRRATHRHPTPQRPTTTSTPPVIAGYTPPSAGSSATSSSGSSGYGGSESTPPPAAPSSPVAQPSGASGRSTSAFGPAGALGPGSSPNG